jgi:hypothetical protein
MHPLVAFRKRKLADAASPASGGFGPGGTSGSGGVGGGGAGGGGGGWGPGGGGCGVGGCGGGGGQVSSVSIVTVSLRVLPPAVPVTVAVFGTTVGLQSAAAVVFLEQA